MLCVNGERVGMIFNPHSGIRYDLSYIREFPKWRRQFIALFIHELWHGLDFVFVCGMNEERWENMRDREKTADFVQDWVLRILFY